jgi:hypothetical protein
MLIYFHFDLQDCMDASMQLCQWFISVRGELEGVADVEIITEEQLNLIEKVKNMDYNTFMNADLDKLDNTEVKNNS